MSAMLAGAAVAVAAIAGAAPFKDPLDVPSAISPLSAHSLLQGVARAGARIVAVGQRGHIVMSDDQGATWRQAKVPVSSDLTAVYFVNDRKGWAVGHDGVVLATTDAGDTWTLQLDGRRANELLLERMQKVAAENPGSAEVKQQLEDAKRYQTQGPDKPFLDVWFADENNGYIVGAYNLIFHTSDGGKSWQSLYDRTDNPKAFNLYAIRPAAGGLFIAGEGGVVLKLDPDSNRFKAADVPYKGSFFGITGNQDYVLVFGLRGNAFRSDDAGGTWVKADVGLPGSIVGAAITAQSTLFMGDLGGRVVASIDGGRTFKALPVKNPRPLAAITDAGNGSLALAGPRGVAMLEIAAR